MEYEAKIIFDADKDHPDFKYMDKIKGLEHSDVYTFDPNYYSKNDKDAMIGYIKSDLALVAGGGYDTEHIHNVKYVINQI